MSSWSPPPMFNLQPGRSSLRVGDHERDAAARLLGEHFAAGRLDHEEYDDRSSRAFSARTYADLDGLFGDLPTERTLGPAGRNGRGSRRPRRSRPPVLAILLILLAIAIVASAPWLLLLAGGVFFLARSGRCGPHGFGHRSV